MIIIIMERPYDCEVFNSTFKKKCGVSISTKVLLLPAL